MIQTGVRWRKTADGRPVYAGQLRAVFIPDSERTDPKHHDFLPCDLDPPCTDPEAHEDSPRPEVSLGLD